MEQLMVGGRMVEQMVFKETRGVHKLEEAVDGKGLPVMGLASKCQGLIRVSKL